MLKPADSRFLEAGGKSMSKFGLPLLIDSDNPVPKRIVGYISVQGKASVFGRGKPALHKSAKAYHADKKDRDSTRKSLEKSGFEILAESALGISVLAEASQYEELTGGKVLPKERLMQTSPGFNEYISCLDIVGTNQPQDMGVGYVKDASLKIDGVVLESPKQFHAVFPSPIPPSSPKFHLRLPGDVATALGVQAAWRKGFHGEGVMIAMPDSGWYRHPYFTANGYNIKKPLVAISDTDPSKDPIGHGTGESANIFAVAPGVVLQPIRGTDNSGNFVGVISAFLKAKGLSPKIITNSWGGDAPYPPDGGPEQSDLAIAAEIKDAIENGILVIFSAGNGQFSVEPQVPGVFLDQHGALQASDYASGYKSPWFDHEIVPTVCLRLGRPPTTCTISNASCATRMRIGPVRECS
jgi:Subtilase family